MKALGLNCPICNHTEATPLIALRTGGMAVRCERCYWTWVEGLDCKKCDKEDRLIAVVLDVPSTVTEQNLTTASRIRLLCLSCGAGMGGGEAAIGAAGRMADPDKLADW